MLLHLFVKGDFAYLLNSAFLVIVKWFCVYGYGYGSTCLLTRPVHCFHLFAKYPF